MKASQLRELIRELIKTQVDEMSTTGALVQPGGQQIATTKAFTSMRDWKKVNKNRKWEESVGGDGTNVRLKGEDEINEFFTIDPDKQLVIIKDAWDDGLHTGRTTSTPSDAESKWEEFKSRTNIRESVNETGIGIPKPRYLNDMSYEELLGLRRRSDFPKYSKALKKDIKDLIDKKKPINESYRKFKKKVTNPRQQMNNSVREIEKHLREVDRIVEYNLKLKTEMDLGGGNFFEGTNKRLARISERINHLNNKLKELGN